MALAAVFIAAILPSSFIDPVTSSASATSTIATRMRALPQAEVELVLKSMVGKPATRMKPVSMLPEPLTRIVDPLPEFCV